MNGPHSTNHTPHGGSAAAALGPTPAAGARATFVRDGAQPHRPPHVPPPSRPIPVPASRATPPVHEAQPERLWTDFIRDAPAWLVSASFHTVLLIVLGLWAAVAGRSAPQEVDIQAEPMRYAEQLGDQLTDPSILEPGGGKELQDPLAEKQILTAQGMEPVDDPFAAPAPTPNVALNGLWAASDIQAPVIGLALTGRQTGTRNVLLGRYGGNATTESAVLKGLEWLARQQRSDGTWSLVGPYNDGGSEENVEAATAMALLAFQGQGTTHHSGKFNDVVAKGWQALLKHQNRDGDFVHNSSLHQRLYAQAQCTIALCELYGMTGDSTLRTPAELTIKYAVKIQDSEGGWRYTPGQDSDTSVTGWFVMALQSARMAKLEVPEQTLTNVTRYLDSAMLGDGKYAYTPGTFSTPAVTAEAYLCRQYLGWKQTDPRLVDGVSALNQHRVNYATADRDVYYWYYATQACHHMEGPIWEQWNAIMRQEVPSHQERSGREAGSWSPTGDKWGAPGGRLYVTCLSIYMLEVYYRHLPIYSGYRFVTGLPSH